MVELELVQELTGHDDIVWNLAWSPDGTELASCSGDKTVRLWREDPSAASWRCVAILEDVHSRTIRSVAWSPDGRLLATASFDRTVAVWEKTSDPGRGGAEARLVWELAATLEGHESEVKGVAWSSDGIHLATCSRDKTVWVWEWAPGNDFEVVDVKQGHSQDVKCVRWHPKGEILVSASYDDSIKLWREEEGDWVCAQTLSGPGSGHRSTVWDVAFRQPGGDLMASVSDDRSLKVWRCSPSPQRPSEPLWRLETTHADAHERAAFSVDWQAAGGDAHVTGSGEQLIATGGADNRIALFRLFAAGEAEAEGAAPTALRSVFMPGPADAGPGPVARPAPLRLELVLSRDAAHASDVNCVRWNPARRDCLASASDDGTVRLWRVGGGAPEGATRG